MFNSIKISCIVLCYNGGDRIISTLESFKLQTYKNKDLVIADDASPDNGYSVSLIENWLKDNKQYFTSVKFIKNCVNFGIVKNIRNASLQAEGDIIFGLGQGDLCYGPDTFDLLAKEISEKYPDKNDWPLYWLGYYLSYRNLENPEPFRQIVSLPYHVHLLAHNDQKALPKLIKMNFIGAPAIIYNKLYYNENVYPLPDSIGFIEDYSLTIWSLITKQKIGSLSMYLRYYENGTGISHKPNQRMKDSLANMYEWLLSLPESTDEIRQMLIAARNRSITLEEYALLGSRFKKMFSMPEIFFSNVFTRIYDLLFSSIRFPFAYNRIRKNSGRSFPLK